MTTYLDPNPLILKLRPGVADGSENSQWVPRGEQGAGAHERTMNSGAVPTKPSVSGRGVLPARDSL